MIKTLTPYPNPAKTAEIMSRYRPIAPKPETCSSNNSISDGSSSSNSLSHKLKQSPYLRNLWPQLQARPTRTRKRGRAPISLPSSLKRQKTHVLGFCQPLHVTSPIKNLSLQAATFVPPSSLPQLSLPNHGIGVLNSNHLDKNLNLVTLPLLPCSPNSPPHHNNASKFELEVIDLNKTKGEIPKEIDLLQQLQKPASTSSNNVINVIAPQPIRPIGSCISVGCINEVSTTIPCLTQQTPKKSEELEQEIESDVLPAVISDSNNRVRMVNSAYKEMVGQPECAWLEVQCGSSSSCKRISGEVTLQICDSSIIPISSNGFSCWARIEWENNGKKKNCVNAFCDVVKLCCDQSRDYAFTWRFHTRSREASQSSCNA
ncbi:uncharacterized protein LOC127098261 [Lathyrus oleraceus]|uniref:uncharacterized protein LOC127098261 n=1 Tax=Pisum sativum TaxID=3888 RepID=UPI001FC5C52A|nr:uncharacterized protein LOC127098261 [Pisum sativum]